MSQCSWVRFDIVLLPVPKSERKSVLFDDIFSQIHLKTCCQSTGCPEEGSVTCSEFFFELSSTLLERAPWNLGTNSL